MIDHLSIQCADPERSAAFYDAVLATVAGERVLVFDADRDAVRAFHRAAVAHGAEVLHGPQVWQEYHPHYFGAFVRDPDGNNVEAVCHTPE